MFLPHFRKQVSLTPHAVCAVDAGIALSYADVDRMSDVLAMRLLKQGVKSSDVVAVAMERSTRFLLSMLALFKVGAAYVPIDRKLPQERVAYMLTKCRVKVALIDVGAEPISGLSCMTVEPVAGPGVDESVLPVFENGPDSLAYVIFTSGSTGKPKGAMVHHAGMYNHLLAKVEDLRMTQTSHVAQTAPQSFDISVWQFLAPLVCGASTVIISSEDFLSNDALETCIRRHAVQILQVVPSHLLAIVEAIREAPTRNYLSSLSVLIATGEALPVPLAAEWLRLRPSVPLVNAYGPTECSDDITHFVFNSIDPRAERVPIGFPVRGVHLHIWDAEGIELPVGEVGELYVSGVVVGLGYFGDDELTAKAFIERNGQRYYRTGDLACRDSSGLYNFYGRVDEQVKIRGFRIELGEVEAALHACGLVKQAAVVVRASPGRPNALTAFVVLEHQTDTPEKSIESDLRERIPDHMVPGTFVFVACLPTNSNGKIDKKQLTQIAAGYAHGARSLEGDDILSICRDVLGERTIQPSDNFFRVGGDSIAALRVIARARRIGFVLALEDVFSTSTIGELAGLAKRTASEGVEEDSMGRAPLSPIQTWFFAQEWANPHYWSLIRAARIHRSPTDEVIRAALLALLDRYPILRTRFEQEDGRWVQDIGSGTRNPSVRRLQLSKPYIECKEQISQLVVEAQREMNLALGDLVRVMLVEDPSCCILILIVHHLVVDAVSHQVLLEELAALCKGEALESGDVSFRSWLLALTRRAQEPTFQESRAYWSTVVATASPSLPQAPQAASGMVSLLTSPTLAKNLNEHAARRAPVHVLLLTAFSRALSRWRGQAQYTVHLEGHGREALVDGYTIARSVGWFTSLYPVVLSHQEDWGALISSPRAMLETLPLRGADYGALRYLAAATELVPLREPHIQFNYLGQVERFDTNLLTPVAPDLLSLLDSISSDSANRRPHPIEIEVRQGDAGFRFDFHYDGSVTTESDVKRLVQLYEVALCDLGEYCDRETPSLRTEEFPLARMTQDELEGLVSRIGDRPEDLYPLGPLQQAILFHHLVEEEDVYPVQLSMELDGAVEVEQLKQAWRVVAARHPALRTGFDWSGISGPIQFVVHAAEAEWHVLDHMEWDVMRVLQHDRARRYDLSSPPLARFYLLQKSEPRHTVMVWSYHHIMMDGWCEAQVLDQLFVAYDALRAGRTQLSEKSYASYRQYAEWLSNQNTNSLQAFWRSYLEGLQPCVLGAHAERGAHGYRSYSLGLTLSNSIRFLCALHAITPTTLFQRVWAEVLYWKTDNPTPVFGCGMSGRTVDVPGVEDIVGVLLSVVPCKVHCGEVSGSSLQELQKATSKLQSHTHITMADLKKLGCPAFDTHLAVENFRFVSDVSYGAMSVKNVEWHERVEPTLVVGVRPGSDYFIEYEFGKGRVSCDEVEALHEVLISVLGRFVDADSQCGNTTDSLPGRHSVNGTFYS